MTTHANHLARGISRRAFLGAGAAGGVALLAGDWSYPLSASPPQKPLFKGSDAPWIDATIPKLHALMASGRLTSRELTIGYLERIERLNPLLHAVIETNPAAVAIAVRRDLERRVGRCRGPLHGIPVLVKDNIATDDAMHTTAGSLALLHSRVPSDARLVKQLRDAGAVILGKTNLSEWANFRGFGSYNGWSARGGFTRCPYVLGNDPIGSSSGSAVSAATNLCSVAVGTETDGSIMAPSHANSTFGLKPTVGRVPGAGIIPIGHSQDTAGPMTRTATDAAILLGVLSSPAVDYTTALHRGALKGARLGVDRKYFDDDFWGFPISSAVMANVLTALESLGAELIDVTTDPEWQLTSNEYDVLLYEFKVQIAEYLAKLRHCKSHTLADLIAFNLAHCPQEMKYFGQEIFELAEATSGDLTDPYYVAARQFCIQHSRTNGIDAALASHTPPLDALIAPTWSWLYSFAAVAGYPSISLPAGYLDDGSPVGFCFVGGAWNEKTLLGFSYDLEQELKARIAPKYLGTVPPEPPDAGFCVSSAAPMAASAVRAPEGRPQRRVW
ncbi:MAG TPA: amidase family protein [Vicinamibacteria bacterium]|nr:amidase family protein [Vicinamibacteria bacterium]